MPRALLRSGRPGVTTHLHNRPALVPGVDYELAIYRRISLLPPTLENAVSGSPDGVPTACCTRRAMKVDQLSPSRCKGIPCRSVSTRAHHAHPPTRAQWVQAAFGAAFRISVPPIPHIGAPRTANPEVDPAAARRTAERSGVGDCGAAGMHSC
jgi:hypothetical protein